MVFPFIDRFVHKNYLDCKSTVLFKMLLQIIPTKAFYFDYATLPF